MTINLKSFLKFELLLLVIGAIFLCLLNFKFSWSYLLGSSVMTIGNMLLLFRFSLRKKRFSALKELLILYISEVFKLVFIAISTALVVLFICPNFWGYILGLVVLQISMAFIAMFVNEKVK